MRSDLIAQINTDALVHNVQVVSRCCAPNVRLCAPLKADAYGHGVNIVAPTLHEAGVDCAGVATVPEAIELRDVGWRRPILVLGNVLAIADACERRERIDAIIEYDLEVTIVDEEVIRHIARTAPQSRIRVHLKLDSGMGRMGVMPEDAARLLALILNTPCLQLVGIFSHFATADAEDRMMAQTQLATFQRMLGELGDRLPADVIRHAANSAATLSLPEAHFDMVRPGLALYGYPPAPHLAGLYDLRPALRLVSHLSAIKELPAGHCVGYGQMFTTRRPTRLGIVPVGYVDGFLRALSNLATIGTSVGDAPVVGRISMDQLAVDLTDLPPLALGSEITLIEDDSRRPNSIVGMANLLGTIPYEVACLLGRRIDRVAVGSFCAQTRSRLRQSVLNRGMPGDRCVTELARVRTVAGEGGLRGVD